MEQVEYLSVAMQLKLISEKKDIFKKELDMVIEERDIIFEQYAAHNTKREYLSFVVGKTKEEIQHFIQAKEDLELLLAHLLAKRALMPQNMELLPADVDANYFEEIEIQSNQAWFNTLNQLEIAQKRWLEFLKLVRIKDFEKKYPVNNMTYYEHIQGIIQHDAYHLGQIVLLSKLV